MSDPKTVRLVALFIGLVALAAVAGTILLLATGRAADAALSGLAGTALGYLAGVMTPSTGSTPQAVTVVNRPGDPVPVEDAGHADLPYLVVVTSVAVIVVTIYHLLIKYA